jgi:hypothetical protein
MLTMLLAYDAAGNVIATLDYLVQYDDTPARDPLGLVDFGAHEEAGGEHTAIWQVQGAAGSKVWPEWIGGRAHDFRVEREGPPGRKHIAALVHKTSGYRRERAAVEDAIASRIAKAKGAPADIRDLVGGPDRPLTLTNTGRTARRPAPSPATLPLVPLASAGQATDTAAEAPTPLPTGDE